MFAIRSFSLKLRQENKARGTEQHHPGRLNKDQKRRGEKGGRSVNTLSLVTANPFPVTSPARTQTQPNPVAKKAQKGRAGKRASDRVRSYRNSSPLVHEIDRPLLLPPLSDDACRAAHLYLSILRLFPADKVDQDCRSRHGEEHLLKELRVLGRGRTDGGKGGMLSDYSLPPRLSIHHSTQAVLCFWTSCSAERQTGSSSSFGRQATSQQQLPGPNEIYAPLRRQPPFRILPTSSDHARHKAFTPLSSPRPRPPPTKTTTWDWLPDKGDMTRRQKANHGPSLSHAPSKTPRHRPAPPHCAPWV